ncbi:unnamed protein product, partial [Soboliphyme baturini]|uniref:FERM domain-containing protein n=1 Tax=Soboliphyme baturini TaxID=241478 RepID=A0A183JB22_9BILA
MLKIADEMDDIKFGMTSNSEVYSALDVKSDGVVLFKKFDEKKDVYDGKYEEDSLKGWIYVNSLPLVIDFNQETAEKIFKGHVKSIVLLFDSKQREGFVDEVKEFAKIAQKFKQK